MFLRWFKRLLLAPFVLLLVWQFWLFGQIAWWRDHNPGMTRFMEIRLHELQQKDPAAQLKKEWLPYPAISNHLKRAIVASEDDLFMAHDGFDWNGIQKAMEKNRQRGKIVAGGSTITQQLAKNLLLTPDKTPWRKAQEALITLMIEALWSKQRILEVYLNVIEWGNGVFGAEAAAQRHFGVSAARLSPEQAARLAVMVPSPRFYDRNRNAPFLLLRTETILGRMPSARIP